MAYSNHRPVLGLALAAILTAITFGGTLALFHTPSAQVQLAAASAARAA
jgi:hypothetical protein